MSNFMQQMILAANPEWAGDRGTTVADMLLKASGVADTTLRDQPVAEAEARTFLALTLRSLGRIDTAEREARRAVELRSQGPERGSLQQAEAIRVLGLVQMDRGEYRDAVASYRQALSILAAVRPPEPKSLCIAHLDAAMALNKLGEFAEAEKILDQGETLVGPLSPRHPDIRADYLGTRAVIELNWKGDLDRAQSLLMENVAIRRQLADQSLLSDAINSLAAVSLRRQHFDEALALYQEALDIQRRLFGDVHQTVAVSLENLANVYFSKKKYAESIARLDEVLAIRSKLFGAESFQVARTRFNIAMVAMNTGDSTRALELFDGALAVFRKELGENHVEVGQILRNRAYCLKGLGRLDEALRDLRSSLAIYDAAVVPAAEGRMRTIADLTEVLCLSGLTDEAERVAGEALGLLDAQKPDHARSIKRLNDQLAKCRGAKPGSPPSGAPAAAPAVGG